MRGSMKLLLMFLTTVILQAHSFISAVNAADFSSSLASVRLHDTHICSGAVLSAEWIITVAHCVEGQLNEWVTVEVNGQIGNVLQIMSHPRYSPLTMDYNVALIKAEIPLSIVQQDSTPYIHLTKRVPLPYENLTVFGYSKHDNEVKYVHIVSPEECGKKYQKYGGVSPRMICVESLEDQQSLCQSDGGSSVVVDGAVIGLVSHGLGCVGVPTVITRLATFALWIAKLTSLSV